MKSAPKYVITKFCIEEHHIEAVFNIVKTARHTLVDSRIKPIKVSRKDYTEEDIKEFDYNIYKVQMITLESFDVGLPVPFYYFDRTIMDYATTSN